MAQLVGLIASEDDAFVKPVGRLLRSGPISVSIVDNRPAHDDASIDLIIVDACRDAAWAMSTIERLRASSPGAGIVAIARETDPDLILQAMRAGANEFFTWPPPEESVQAAIRRTAARRESVQGARPGCSTLLCFGAKGGVGTTTVAVNCGVDIARLTKRPTIILDLKPGLGEVALFLGVRPRYTLLDALDNLHRLDREFLRELVVKHKSGLDILAGSDQFDRPGAGDAGGVEEIFRLLARQYEYILVDAGNQINSVTVAALYTADTMFLVANPDVPSVRNAQRLLERVRQLGACGERMRLLLNRAAEPYPIPPKQIESALGHPIHHRFTSDYKTVSTALNSGVPLAQAGDSEIAAQFDAFSRSLVHPDADAAAPAPAARRSRLGLERLASIW